VWISPAQKRLWRLIDDRLLPVDQLEFPTMLEPDAVLGEEA